MGKGRSVRSNFHDFELAHFCPTSLSVDRPLIDFSLSIRLSLSPCLSHALSSLFASSLFLYREHREPTSHAVYGLHDARYEYSFSLLRCHLPSLRLDRRLVGSPAPGISPSDRGARNMDYSCRQVNLELWIPSDRRCLVATWDLPRIYFAGSWSVSEDLSFSRVPLRHVNPFLHLLPSFLLEVAVQALALDSG